MVLTAPEPLTLKLVELNKATPTVLVVARATETCPVADIDSGAAAATTIVPELSGRVIVLVADGLAGDRVMELLPDSPSISEVPI